jgi:hypothetical protein
MIKKSYKMNNEILQFFNEKEKEIERLKRELTNSKRRSELDIIKLKEKFEKEKEKISKEVIFNFQSREKYNNIVRKKVTFKNLKKNIINFNNNSTVLSGYGLKIKKIILTETEYFDVLKFDINNDKIRYNADTVLYLKDKFKCSDELYQAFKRIFKMPTFASLRNRRVEINKMHPIESFEHGYFVDPSFKLNQIIANLISKKSLLFTDTSDIIIKLQMDGFSCYNEQSCLNFAFSIINEKTVATTASGTYTIGLFEIENESYENLSPIVKEIWQKLKSLKQFSYKNQEFAIKYRLGGDLKMIALVKMEYFILMLTMYLIVPVLRI